MSRNVDDLIVLGRSAPEPIKKDGRHTVCLAGWSNTLDGFVRLYPTKISTKIRRWSQVEVPVEKDPSHDPRAESYKIEGSRRDWDKLHKKIREIRYLGKRERIQLMERLPKRCPSELYNNNQNLGVVSPKVRDCYLKEIKEEDRTPPINYLFQEKPLKSKKSYPNQVRIKYTCQNCLSSRSYHDQHCMEWGIYQFWEKNPDADPSQVIDNLRIMDDNYKKYLIVGNLRAYPKSFVIISVIRFKKSELWKAVTLLP